MKAEKVTGLHEQDFALWIRRLLLLIVKAIELRYNIN